APDAVADVEDHASADRPSGLIADTAALIEDALLAPVEAVGHHVAATQLAQDVLEGNRRVAHVDHERQPGRGRGFEGRAERQSGVAAGLLARQSYLHAVDEVAVGLDGLERLGPVDEADVLQLADLAAQHSGAADVEEREDARFRHLDHVLAEPGERERPRRARVDDGGGAGRQTVRIRLDAVVRGAVVDVDVEIDEAGCHEEAPGIDDLLARDGPEILAEGGHASVGEPNVPQRGGPERGVDDGPALDQHRRGPTLSGGAAESFWTFHGVRGGYGRGPT